MVTRAEHIQAFKLGNPKDDKGSMIVGGAVAPDFDSRFSEERARFQTRPMEIVKTEGVIAVEGAMHDREPQGFELPPNSEN